ncbi:hypothetical protein SEVIR_6G064501v4 [Setaria viridis]
MRLEVNGEVAIRLRPLELPHQVGHEVSEVEHGGAHAGTHPPATPERHHPDLPGAARGRHQAHALALAAGQEPLWPELARVRPRRLVPCQPRQREVHRRARRETPAVHHDVVLRHHLPKHHRHGGVQPEPFHDDGVEVLQFPENLLGVRGHGGVAVVPERALRVGAFHQVRHDPLQRRRGGLRAGAEELGAEPHKLAVREPPLLLLPPSPEAAACSSSGTRRSASVSTYAGGSPRRSGRSRRRESMRGRYACSCCRRSSTSFLHRLR